MAVLAANSKHWFTTNVLVPESDARSVCLLQTPSTGLRHPSWCRKAMLGVSACCKLQALVYDIRLGAGKRCSEPDLAANSKHWFTTSFLVPESDARSVCLLQTPSTGLRHPSWCRKAMLGMCACCWATTGSVVTLSVSTATAALT